MGLFSRLFGNGATERKPGQRMKQARRGAKPAAEAQPKKPATFGKADIRKKYARKKS